MIMLSLNLSALDHLLPMVASNFFIAEDSFRVQRGSVLTFNPTSLGEKENGYRQIIEFSTELMEFEGLLQVLKDNLSKKLLKKSPPKALSMSNSMESKLDSLALKPISNLECQVPKIVTPSNHLRISPKPSPRVYYFHSSSHLPQKNEIITFPAKFTFHKPNKQSLGK